MTNDTPLAETNRRLALAYDYLLARLKQRPQSYTELLNDAYEWGLNRDDLFIAKRALGVTTKHRKWVLPQ